MIDRLALTPSDWDALVRSCTRVTGNRHDAEDAVQDAVLRVLRRLPDVEGDDLSGYLFVAARNTARTKVTRARHHGELAETLADPAPAVDELAERRERRAQLAAALREIPARQARAVALIDVHGASTEEAAEVLELKPNAVNQLVFRGRNSLRAQLQAA